MDGAQEKILVIKLGALGDFIQALGPMAAIRRHHPEASITLLTTKPYQKFAQDCGYFNEIWLDDKPKLTDISSWVGLKKKLNQAGFSRVYDLQNNDRTAFYFKLLKRNGRPEWVGTAHGCSHRNTSPDRTAGHAFDGHLQTLALAGISDIEIDRLEWMNGDISSFLLKGPFALLVPGCAPERPEKRWPACHYGELAKLLIKKGIRPVVLGTFAEKEAMEDISKICPQALDLIDQTSFAQIVSLARKAVAAVGNDTGPMHLIAATGCSSLVLFSKHSNPVRHAPKGKSVFVFQADSLDELKAEAAFRDLCKFMTI